MGAYSVSQGILEQEVIPGITHVHLCSSDVIAGEYALDFIGCQSPCPA